MKLEGSLDAFSLPDIFQLLSFTKKTGGLHLAHDGADGVVYVAGGQVTGASADSSRQPLARRLVGSGTVDDDALTAAVESAAAGEGIGVVRSLLEAGAVDADLLRQAATDQAVDAVFDLLRWRDGDFAFVVDETNPDDVGVELSVESVLADAHARHATWDTVSQVVPSPRAVLAMPVVLPDDPKVSREEWSLLALVDGRRTVSELVDLTGSGQYAVVSTLAALVERGLLEVHDEDAADDDHVAVVLRRQRLLSPLEGQPFVPVTNGVEDVDVPDGRTDNGGAAAGAAAGTTLEVPLETADPELVPAAADGPVMLGGAHVPQDVVPPRPEPFLPRRQADFEERESAPVSRHVPTPVGPADSVGQVVGATATSPDPAAASVIERDPSVNRSLMLRLIAGVRGL
jgi:hypothetical protein